MHMFNLRKSILAAIGASVALGAAPIDIARSSRTCCEKGTSAKHFLSCM